MISYSRLSGTVYIPYTASVKQLTRSIYWFTKYDIEDDEDGILLKYKIKPEYLNNFLDSIKEAGGKEYE